MSCPLFQPINEPGDLFIGIDEAGKGPVLGPMVYTAFFTTSPEIVSTLGFKDSKVLTPEKRYQLYQEIKQTSCVGYATALLTPSFITHQMCSPNKISLNEIAYNAVLKLIEQIINQTKRQIKTVYADTVGPAATYKKTITQKFPQLKNVIVCPKADSKYPVVSAASIVAKVTRDGCNQNVGSGYPGDSNTTTWMAKSYDPVFGYPNLVRFGWETSKRILSSKNPIYVPFPYIREEKQPNETDTTYFSSKGMSDVIEW
ncbi:Ribonuclease [Entamoeba marina]